jgi:septum formation protein
MAYLPSGLNWPKIILASASPRRAQLLRQVGADFIVKAPDIDEAACSGLGPEQMAVALAVRKAESVSLSCDGRLGGRVILAADTVVSYRRHLLGKPAGRAQALRMLKLLSGKRHQVITGICLMGAEGRRLAGCQVSSVQFRRLTDSRIRWYLTTGEFWDKAGAYGIQGRGALLVARVEGCYFNIVGLPLALLDRMLARFSGAIG